MSAADKIKEADWRLFRSRLPIWQEAYMERLNREYIALLSGTGPASEKFWELERRMREDKRRGGVVMRMSRSNMELNLLSLLSDGVISTAELDGFSEELREKLAFVLRDHRDWDHGDKGMETIQRHAADFVRTRLAPASIPNDGKQTPMRGHPVFIAQHACACCCRGCLHKWYHVPVGRELTENEQERIVKLLMAWIERQLDCDTR